MKRSLGPWSIITPRCITKCSIYCPNDSWWIETIFTIMLFAINATRWDQTRICFEFLKSQQFLIQQKVDEYFSSCCCCCCCLLLLFYSFLFLFFKFSFSFSLFSNISLFTYSLSLLCVFSISLVLPSIYIFISFL